MDTCTLNYNPPLPIIDIYTQKRLYNIMYKIHPNENMNVEGGSSYILIICSGVNELTVRIYLVTIYITIQ